jgi:hypothetical protein
MGALLPVSRILSVTHRAVRNVSHKQKNPSLEMNYCCSSVNLSQVVKSRWEIIKGQEWKSLQSYTQMSRHSL